MADAAALLGAMVGSDQDDEATRDLVIELRDDIVPTTLEDSGITAHVGGVTAALEDQSEYIKDRMPVFISGVVGLSFLLLLVAFHSPLISLKAGVMNLLSVSAAYGVMTLVAKGGAVGELIGIDHEVPIAPFMPVMMFAILFGLSMDYMVFIGSRIREEHVHGLQTREAVDHGIAAIGRVVVAAALIMGTVFAAFILSADRIPKEFGLLLAVAILTDALIVRMTLVPAFLTLMRERSWYIPGWLDRLLPNVTIEPPHDGEVRERFRGEPAEALGRP